MEFVVRDEFIRACAIHCKERAAASGSRGLSALAAGRICIGKTDRRDVTSCWGSELVNGHTIWMILMRRIVRHHAGGRISIRGVWQGGLRWREGSEGMSGRNRRVQRLVEAISGRLRGTESNVHSLSSVPSIPPSPIRCRCSGRPSEAAKQRLNNGQDRHVIH